MRLRRVWLLVPLVAAAGCARASWVGPIDPRVSDSPGASREARVTIVGTEPGMAVSSPIAVEARATAPEGTRVAAVLSVSTMSGGRKWLGAAPLTPAEGGRHTGTIAFEIESGTVAELEVVVSRVDDGSVMARDAVSITLISPP